MAKYKYNGNDKIKQGTVTKSSNFKSFSSDKNEEIFFSMESVEQVGRRERFLQSTFESLSGGDLAHFFKKTFYLF